MVNVNSRRNPDMKHPIASLLVALISVAILTCPGCRRSEQGHPAETADQAHAAKELSLDLGNNVALKLAYIPFGEMVMARRRRVQITEPYYVGIYEVTRTQYGKPFYLSIYEVTQKQYEQVMSSNPSHFKGARNPVENITWEDAAEFCKNVSQKTNTIVRLPAGVEWEYACRAGTTTRFSHGNEERALDEYAWHSENADRKTHPVGQKKPNAWGLYDMHGNVWEWCADLFGTPKGFRVLRGGSWLHPPAVCRSDGKSGGAPDYKSTDHGFRVVVDVPEDTAPPKSKLWAKIVLESGMFPNEIAMGEMLSDLAGDARLIVYAKGLGLKGPVSLKTIVNQFGPPDRVFRDLVRIDPGGPKSADFYDYGGLMLAADSQSGDIVGIEAPGVWWKGGLRRTAEDTMARTATD